jgi:hypothetical protein
LPAKGLVPLRQAPHFGHIFRRIVSGFALPVRRIFGKPGVYEALSMIAPPGRALPRQSAGATVATLETALRPPGFHSIINLGA